MTDSTPKKRGRPATGEALSPAERKRRQRERDRTRVYAPTEETDGKPVTVTGMLELLAEAVRLGNVTLAERLAAELLDHARRNAEKP